MEWGNYVITDDFGNSQNSKKYTNCYKQRMEDVKRSSHYTEYPKKKLTPEDEALNYYGLISLVSGLIAVLMGVFY